jgi:hypothetical protein
MSSSSSTNLYFEPKRIYADELFIRNDSGTAVSVVTNNLYLIKDNLENTEFKQNLSLKFEVYKQGSPIPQQTKVLFNISLFYKFNDFVPDFNFEVLERTNILYSESIGVESYPNVYNRYTDSILLDISNIANISFGLSKVDTSNNSISIKSNSFLTIVGFGPE